MRSRGRLYQIVAILGPAILIVAGAAPGLVCHAGPPQAREAQPTQGRGTLAQRSTAKLIPTPDPNVEWRITDNRFVERTANGGRTWQGQGLGTQVDLLAGSAPDANVCWVVGRNGAVFVAKGAGNGNKPAWYGVPAPVAADLGAVSAKSASSAIVTTADGRQFETHDGGKKWKQANVSR